jgi:hypothetical protein
MPKPKKGAGASGSGSGSKDKGGKKQVGKGGANKLQKLDSPSGGDSPAPDAGVVLEQPAHDLKGKAAVARRRSGQHEESLSDQVSDDRIG